MIEQLTIADAPMRRTSDPDTSQPPTQPRLSAGRFDALQAHYCRSNGLTDFELADITGKAQTSIGKRRGDLVRLGLIEATDLRRPSPTGSPAVVWRITAAGVETYRGLA